MESSSATCNMTGFATIGASEIIDNFAAVSQSVEYLTSYKEHVQCGSISSISTKAISTASTSKFKKPKDCITFMVNERGEITDRNGHKPSKLQLAKIEQAARVKQRQKQGSKKSKKEEIEDFIQKFQRSQCYSDVPVATMRHIIPLLLMEIYPHHYGRFSRKVKGMWERKPQDWPEDVRFLDPNNKIKESDKHGAKPTKEILVPMLIHLVKKYVMQKENATCHLPRVQRSDHLLSTGLDPDEENVLCLHDEPEDSKCGSGSMDRNPSSGDLSLTSTMCGFSGISKSRSVESSVGMSMIPHHSSLPGGYGIQCQLSSETAAAVAGIPSLQSHLSSSSLPSGSLNSSGVQCTHSHSWTVHHEQICAGSLTSHRSGGVGSFASQRSGGVVSYLGSTPQQVEDEDEQLDWNPVDDVIHRIKSKIKYLWKSVSVPDSDAELLSMARDVVCSQSVETSEDRQLLIERAHVVESVIDVIKLDGCLPVDWKHKLNDYQRTYVKEQNMEDGETGYVILLSANTEAENSASVLQQVAFDEHLVSQLNIERRPAVGDSLLATSDVLEVRSQVSASGDDGESCRDDVRYSAGDWLNHWQAGLQETGASIDKQAVPEASEKSDQHLEIDLSLNDIINNPQLDSRALLNVLDTGIEQELYSGDGSRSVEVNGQEENGRIYLLQPATCEDAIDGPPVLFEHSYGAVTGTFGSQPPTSGLPCTTKSTAAYSSASYSVLPTAARPVAESGLWKSLPTESCAGGRGLAEFRRFEENSEHRTQCISLPMPASSVWSSPYQLPSSLSRPLVVAKDRVIHTDLWHAGLLDTAAAEKQAVTEVTEKNEPTVQSLVAQKTPDLLQKCTTPVYLQTVNAGALLNSQSLASVARDRLMPSAAPAKDRILSVRSPVGQITGPMSDLSIYSGHHPLLRGILTEAAQTAVNRDQKSGEDIANSAAKRSAPIPVMVEQMDVDDGSFAGPSMKKVRPSEAHQ